MAEEQKEQQAQAEIENLGVLQRVRGEKFLHFYSNNIQVGMSQWDMRITLGEIVEHPDGKLVIEDRATVVMSLQHAKAAITVLARSFAALEKQFGEIKLLEPLQQ